MWMWPGPEGFMKKAVVGNFATNLVITMDDGKETTTTKSHSNSHDEGGHSTLDDVKSLGVSDNSSMDDSAGFQRRNARVAATVSVLAMAFAM